MESNFMSVNKIVEMVNTKDDIVVYLTTQRKSKKVFDGKNTFSYIISGIYTSKNNKLICKIDLP